MRITLVHSYYGAATPSGENVAVDAQRRALEAAGHRVELVATGTDDLSEDRLYPVRAGWRALTGGGATPVEQVHRSRPDIVHLHNAFPNWGRRWVEELEVPLVATLHNFRASCAAGTFFRDGRPCHECVEHGSRRAVRHACYRGSRLATLPLAVGESRGAAEHPVVRRAAALVTMSPRARAELERAGVPVRLLRVVPNFVEDPARRAAGPGAGPVDPTDRWLYTGRLAPEKGILPLLRSWPADRRLDVVGAGPEQELVAAEAARHPGVRVLGLRDHDALVGMLPAYRGLVLPSMWAESSPPLTYLEALASGVPVAALAGSSAADDLAAHEGGTVFERFDGLAEALARVESGGDDMRRAARARFESAFTARAWVSSIREVYDEVLSRSDR